MLIFKRTERHKCSISRLLVLPDYATLSNKEFVFVFFVWKQGPDSIQICPLAGIGNPIVEIRRSHDRLISTMGFPILVRCHLYIESGPRRESCSTGTVAHKETKESYDCKTSHFEKNNNTSGKYDSIIIGLYLIFRWHVTQHVETENCKHRQTFARGPDSI